MGSAELVTDYFRPVIQMPFCDFLKTRTQFRWTHSVCAPWKRPQPYFKWEGGSAANWTANNAPGGDLRPYIAFWGSGSGGLPSSSGNGDDEEGKGGCCCKDYQCKKPKWNQPFTISLASLAVVSKNCDAARRVRGKFKLYASIRAGDDTSVQSWYTRGCEKMGLIGTNVIVKVHMGEVKDYFKPSKPVRFCTFLTGNPTYLWSRSLCGPWDGSLFPQHKNKQVKDQINMLGGSMMKWPTQFTRGDNRPTLSVWGA